jgi:hypothetical protein
MHVEQVLGHVPPAKRCRCADGGPVGPPAEATGLWGRLAGKMRGEAR